VAGGEITMLSAASATIGQSAGFSVPWARIALSLLFCLTLAVAAIAFIRRRSGAAVLPSFASLLSSAERGKQRDLELLERLQLSPASQICLVRCGNKRLLVHVSAGGAQVLERLDTEDVHQGDR
jgi:flagellar biogenesis protein FliO